MAEQIFELLDINIINNEVLQLQFFVNNNKDGIETLSPTKLRKLQTLFNYRQTAKVTLLYLRKINMWWSV